MSRPELLKLMAPSRNKEKFSRLSSLFKFEGEPDNLELRVKLEVTRFAKSGSDGSGIKEQKLVREFAFRVDPLDLGSSALLACAGRKNDLAIYNRGNELKKITQPVKPDTAKEVDGEKVIFRRKTETIWAKDKESLWELQTFQTQRTRRMVTSFIRDTFLIAENLLSDMKNNDGKVSVHFAEQLASLMETANQITNRKESALFELKMIPIAIDGVKSETIKFQLDEIGVMSMVDFCKNAADANYTGHLLFFGGLKVMKRKGKVIIATGTVFESLTEEQVVGIKVGIVEFLELGHVAKHSIRGGITITSPPIVTKAKELVDGGQLLLNIRDRKVYLNYFDAAKLYVFL